LLSPRTTVEERDGYGAVRAWLPPPERRALVLIDPPFEAQDEFAQIASALDEGLRRLRGGVFAVWYPLTERARVDAFFAELLALKPPPTLELELTIAGESSPLKLRGCGLAVINPPWQFDRAAGALLEFLGGALAQAPGGGGRVRWLVPE
jgi:23S rRNA (adenine2030-N6)-methyltransferase